MGDEPVKGGSPQENKTKSFAFQVTVAFILTAAMTAVLMAGVAFLVWSAGRGRFFGEQDLYTAMLIAAFISVLVAVIVVVILSIAGMVMGVSIMDGFSSYQYNYRY